MPIDPKQFIQTFVEESLEMLQSMEEALITLDLDQIDDEKINTAFRTVHSLKSSSTMFNLNDISDLSQTLENYLQQVRSKQRRITRSDVDLLLTSVDCYRKIINAVRDKKDSDSTQVKSLNHIFSQVLLGEDSAKLATSLPSELSEKKPGNCLSGWRIRFRPVRETFKSGNEPSRLFATLAELGKIEVVVDTSDLPLLSNLDPESCYLNWNIVLYSEIGIVELQEIFSWMAEEENYNISPIVAEDQIEDEVVAVKSHKAEIKHIEPRKIESNDDYAQKSVIKDDDKINKISSPLQATSIRVATQKVDNLVDLIGELIITQSMINQIAKDFTPAKLEKLTAALTRLDFDSRNLQEGILSIRMLPIGFVFNRLPRMLHDISQKLGKSVELNIAGEETEIDKNLMEKIFNPLVHIVRNAVDHGIEMPDVRESHGKRDKGLIQLYAYHEGGNIVISVEDDGKGIDLERIRTKAIELGLIDKNEHLSDDELYQFMFKAGFSTSEKVTEISGRGVGLDVVYNSVKELGGNVQITSIAGSGTKFSLSLPITLSIMDCQLVKVGDYIYSIPLVSITEILKINHEAIIKYDNYVDLYELRDQCIPMINLCKQLGMGDDHQNESDNHCLIICEHENKSYGLIIHELLSQQRVVIKNLEDNYKKINFISGATILGDGSVALIIDTNEVIANYIDPSNSTERATAKEMESRDGVQSTADSINENDPFQFLSFIMAGNEYGINILEINEIIELSNITPVPNAPKHVMGVFNLRGTIIPILDLCKFFEIERNANESAVTVIVLAFQSHGRDRHVGIIVDSVSNSYTIPYGVIDTAPEKQDSKLSGQAKGLVMVDDKVITLLDTQRLLLHQVDHVNLAR